MREILRLAGVLTLICVVCTALLAAVHERTRGPIERAAAARRVATARDVLPPDAPRLRPVVAGGATNFAAFDERGKLLATAVEGRSGNGYGGEIVIMAGISADGRLIDFKVLEDTETPGLGKKIAAPAFARRVQGRAIDADWRVRQDGGEIEAVTAATISSRAVLEAIRDAIARHRAVLAALAAGGEEPPAALPPAAVSTEEP